MLVLNCVEKDKVVIRHRGMRYFVSVVEIRNGRVRLGFQAPEEVEINRKNVDQKRYPEDYGKELAHVAIPKNAIYDRSKDISHG